MFEFLPKEVRAGLDEARKRDLKRRSRLRVLAGTEVWQILRQWHGGFALDAAEVTTLRGLVDVYDGSRHLMQCLIVASDVADGELICTVKRSTRAAEQAPLDFARDENAPVALISRV